MKRPMKRLILFLTLLCTVLAHAQNTVTITASNIQNGFGVKLASGQACFQATAGGLPVGFRMGGGGQAINRPVCTAVSNGSLSATLPNTANTVPANVCLNFTVRDLSTNQIVLGLTKGDNGYGCLQPSGGSSQSSWCTSSSGIACNLDNYPPNLTALGIYGLTGPPGTTTVALVLTIGTCGA